MESQVADRPPPKLRRDGRLRLPSRRILTGFRQRTPRISSEAIHHHRFAIPDAHGCSGRFRAQGTISSSNPNFESNGTGCSIRTPLIAKRCPSIAWDGIPGGRPPTHQSCDATAGSACRRVAAKRVFANAHLGLHPRLSTTIASRFRRPTLASRSVRPTLPRAGIANAHLGFHPRLSTTIASRFRMPTVAQAGFALKAQSLLRTRPSNRTAPDA